MRTDAPIYPPPHPTDTGEHFTMASRDTSFNSCSPSLALNPPQPPPYRKPTRRYFRPELYLPLLLFLQSALLIASLFLSVFWLRRPKEFFNIHALDPLTVVVCAAGLLSYGLRLYRPVWTTSINVILLFAWLVILAGRGFIWGYTIHARVCYNTPWTQDYRVARQCSSVKAGFALSVCVVATYVGVLLLAIVAVVARRMRRSILHGRIESQEMKDLDLAASQGLITSFAVDKEHDAEDIESEKTGVDCGEF